ncbi:MAG: hypothetical protein LBD64_00910, partial [Odoribacteraceae bacterium]|nr:hypothetical protein [Odoribacteraceae bacterium]
ASSRKLLASRGRPSRAREGYFPPRKLTWKARERSRDTGHVIRRPAITRGVSVLVVRDVASTSRVSVFVFREVARSPRVPLPDAREIA